MVVKIVRQTVGKVFTFFSPHRGHEAGYLLPVVIVLGMAVGTVSVVALQSTANNSTILNDQYYDSTAREAAKAGIATAYKCLNATNTNWTTNLVGTNCSGGGTEIKVTTGDRFESTYSVSPPDTTTYPPSGTNVRIIITSVGTVTIMDGSGNPVKTIKKSVRALGKVTTIPGGPSGPTTTILAADRISTGPSTACAIANDWPYCWGSNSGGMLGNGGWNFVDNRSRIPIEVASAAINRQVSSSSNPCDNNFFTFSIPDCAGARAASAMAGLKVKKVSVGSTHVCAIASANSASSSGQVYCWGKNDTGQLGDLTEDDRSTPVAVYTGGPMNRTCTGRDFFGNCNRYDIVRNVDASALRNADGSPKEVTDISAGDGFTCALTSDEEVVCWGANSRGQLGNDTRNNAAIPVAISKASSVQEKTCVDWEYGITYYFGNQNDKWCATNGYNPANDTVPSALIGKQVKKLAKMKGSGATMCVLTTQDKPVCWGENYGGQAGGTSVPSRMTGTSTVQKGNPNQCNEATREAKENARNYVNMNRAHYYDALRPVAIQTSLTFSELTIVSNGTIDDYASVDGDIYTYVTGKSSASSSMDRLFYWGGKTDYTSTSRCQRNSDTYYGDWARATVTLKVDFSGQATPIGPLYDNSSAGALQGQPLTLNSGNPITDIFCAQAAAALYCDVHGAMAQQGQLGNGYSCSYFCSGQNGVKAVSLRDGSNNPTWLFGKNIIALDTGDDYTCAVADNGAIGCWGYNASGQLGDGSTSNRTRPVSVNFPITTTPTTPTSPTTGSTTTYDLLMYF